MTVLEVENLKKIYRPRFGGNQVQALSKVTFSVEEGEYVAIMGESGSGKTTLLNMLAALDKPTEGEVYLDGKPLSAIREKDLSKFRREHLGYVFQDFNLMDTFNLKDNILLPLVLQGGDYRKMNVRMMPIVKELGIAGLLIIVFSTVTTTFLDAYSAGISSESVFSKINGKYAAIVVTVIGMIGAIIYPMDNITDFLYLIGSVFAPMIAIQIADFFILKRKDSLEVSLDVMNGVIWVIGFILYRILMNVDIPLGNTLPDMVITIVICILARKCIKTEK